MQSPRKISLIISLLISLTALAAQALDLSVPYVRGGLPYLNIGYGYCYTGYGAIVGQIEVRNNDGNGIDGFDGHRLAGLAPDPTDTEDYGKFGYIDVKDFTGMDKPADNDFLSSHGTFVAGIMASEYSATDGTPFLGVAPLAKYYGAIFDGADTKQAFLSLNNSLNYTTVVSHASVVNSSWGAKATDASELDGKSATALLMDEYAGYSGKTGGTTGAYLDKLMVIAAGNDGGTTGLLGTPADSYNGLVVGALDAIDPTATGAFDPNRGPAARVASYSSWRPLADGRAGVDVVAPGTNLYSTVGLNFPIDGPILGVGSGTSFAAPHVTGEAALLYAAAADPNHFISAKWTVLSTDHKLIKAIIINSADKIAGRDVNGAQQSTWQPGKVILTDKGVPNAVVPLNYAVGAGSANAYEALLQYYENGDRFWDLNTFSHVGSNIYYTFGVGKFQSESLDQAYSFALTATLVWDRHVDFTVSTDVADPSGGDATTSLSDLDLILQELINGVWQDIYMSAGDVQNVEHIYEPMLSGTDAYRLEVSAKSLADAAAGEDYALAVSFTAVPEPGTWTLLITGLLGLVVWVRVGAPRGLSPAKRDRWI